LAVQADVGCVVREGTIAENSIRDLGVRAVFIQVKQLDNDASIAISVHPHLLMVWHLAKLADVIVARGQTCDSRSGKGPQAARIDDVQIQ
jgi:hypothetical protein